MTGFGSSLEIDRWVGLTSTIPQEIIWAAEKIPRDLNNLFIGDSNPDELIVFAENRGFPRNVCSWIKGIYGAVHKYGIKSVVGVTGGDCSNTVALLEVLKSDGVKVFAFDYPASKSSENLAMELTRLADFVGIDLTAAEQKKVEFDLIRRDLKQLVMSKKLSPAEKFTWLVSASDFNGNYCNFQRELAEKLIAPELFYCENSVADQKYRIGLLGVPPVYHDLIDYLVELGLTPVYFETAEEFSLCNHPGNLTYSYLEYSYPYGIESRIAAVSRQLQNYRIDGLIHYVQSFCHRSIEDILFKRAFSLPILTVEGDRPGKLDERTRLRISAWSEIL